MHVLDKKKKKKAQEEKAKEFAKGNNKRGRLIANCSREYLLEC